MKINPRGTSSKCPICWSKLKENDYRKLGCPSCGFKGSRNYVNVRVKALSGRLDNPKQE
ncbi:hypothetical protein DRO30_03280 [Candidatus Bathyarchaeota archaeon]|nr:MAG: hypothetical protein DRO30_03280 [Candidatus Bathyarchaeota archaeon]